MRRQVLVFLPISAIAGDHGAPAHAAFACDGVWGTAIHFAPISAFAPACAHTASLLLASPETPIAPMILPSTKMGIPPSTGTAPSRPRMRRPAPPAASASWKALVGRLNRAADRALLMETC